MLTLDRRLERELGLVRQALRQKRAVQPRHKRLRLTRAQAQCVIGFMRAHPEVSVKIIADYLGKKETAINSLRASYLRLHEDVGEAPPVDSASEDRVLLQHVLAQIYGQVKRQRGKFLQEIKKGKSVTLALKITPPRPLRARLLR